MRLRALLATWMLTVMPCLAAEWRPVAVVSFVGWEELEADLAFLGQLVQAPELPQTFGKALAKDTGVKELTGLDGRRPWGAVVQTDGLRFASAAFVPVNDPETLLKALTPLVGEAQSVAPGVWKIGRQKLTGFVRYHDGWLYLSQTQEDLDTLPDPQAVLGGFPSRHELAVAFYPRNLPEALRTLAIDHVREERQMRLEMPPDRTVGLLPSPALARLIYGALEDFFTDADRFTIGWTLDRQRKTAAIEVSITPIAGRRLARRWESQRRAVSRLRPHGQNIPAWLDLAVAIDREKTQARTALSTEDSVLSTLYVDSVLTRAACFTPTQQKVVLSCVDVLNALVADITRAESREIALRVHGKNPPYVIIAAARLNEPPVVERTLKALAEAVDVDGSFLRVKLNIAHQGPLRVHALELTGIDDLPLQKLLGDEATLYVATTGEYVVIAYGHRAMAALQNCLPITEQPTDCVRMLVHVGAFLTALARGSDDRENLTLLMLIGLTLQASDDRLFFTVDPDEEGLKAQLELREGVLRALALGLNLGAREILQDSRGGSAIPRARTP